MLAIIFFAILSFSILWRICIPETTESKQNVSKSETMQIWWKLFLLWIDFVLLSLPDIVKLEGNFKENWMIAWKNHRIAGFGVIWHDDGTNKRRVCKYYVTITYATYLEASNFQEKSEKENTRVQLNET